MQDEYLTRCVVDPVSRKFFLYSNEGEERVVDCDTVDQFMAVLELCRDNLDEDTLAYSNPLWPKSTFNSKNRAKKIPVIFDPITFLWIFIHPIFITKFLSVTSMRPETRQSMEMLFAAKWNLPKAAKNCNLTDKEMKITFNEYCRLNGPSYEIPDQLTKEVPLDPKPVYPPKKWFCGSVAESVDAPDLKSVENYLVGVQVPPLLPKYLWSTL